MKDRSPLINFFGNVTALATYGVGVFFGTDTQVSQQPPYGSEPQVTHQVGQVEQLQDCTLGNLNPGAQSVFLSWMDVVGRDGMQRIIQNGGLPTMGGDSAEKCPREETIDLTVDDFLAGVDDREMAALHNQLEQNKPIVTTDGKREPLFPPFFGLGMAFACGGLIYIGLKVRQSEGDY
ncbi:hypothetical protein IPM62_01940 [Candidatus Woesebacteria bacterium]|nr:MAG: hypothetical protein IPM62_01940 [Candidatus Woesebacteria bacterium]